MSNNIKERSGWEWKDTFHGGYWVKITGPSHPHKLPLFCPHCQRITGTIDDKYLHQYGICAECYVMYIEDRKVPIIDISIYQK